MNYTLQGYCLGFLLNFSYPQDLGVVLVSHLIIYLDYIATGVCGGLRLRAVYILYR